MHNSIESRITNYFVKIGVANTEEFEILEFGLKLLMAKSVHIISILFIGIISNELLNTMIFLLTYCSISEYSGGYHAKTSLGCYVFTIVVILTVTILFKSRLALYSIVVLTILITSGAVIWSFSPQESSNKPLETWEIQRYRNKARGYLVILEAVAMLVFSYQPMRKGIMCALLIQAIMLIIGMLRK